MRCSALLRKCTTLASKRLIAESAALDRITQCLFSTGLRPKLTMPMSLDSLKGYPLYQRKFLDVAVNLVKVWWPLGPGHTQRDRYLPRQVMERRKYMHMPLAFCQSETRVPCSPAECLSTQHAPSTPPRTSKWSPTHWPNSRTFAWWSRCAAFSRRGKGFPYLYSYSVQCTSPVPSSSAGFSLHDTAFHGKTDRCSRP
jgi:hypothetical protein